ncbi:PP2C family protein-serine/threonine phosphatase [Acidicapsa dinghuensis]|uniref:PP2C family protein-serine/threonine phosphatase n=1 Tax=Acidicapsa dinghuensis TaxID=2218256 RepID=A0ABW1EA93_9BACT|nr:PP2C family protein-serine/threonine phosphatase [Acidicapsa dinghuensis]
MRRLVFAALAAGAFLVAAPAVTVRAAAAQPASSKTVPVQPKTAEIHLGESVVALNSPWKFSTGDSPLDPATGKPVWADPAFDDAHWEDVDLTPKSGAQNPITGLSDYVPGWTARGHAGYAGYAWYRIRVHVDARGGLQLALAGPAAADDSYQVFDNGVLLGSFGDFSGKHIADYYSRPLTFPMQPQAAAGESIHIIAFRFWMAPPTLFQASDVGGFESAPLIGEADAIHNLERVLFDDLIRAYLWSPFEAGTFALLAIVAFSLALFDRSDRVYLWIGGLLLLLSIDGFSGSMSVWTTWISSRYDLISHEIVLFSLQYAGWVMVWRTWFRQRRPVWMPWALIPLVILLIAATAFSRNIFYQFSSPTLITDAHAVSLLTRFAMSAFLLQIVFNGIREYGIEGWLVLPAVLLAGAAEFARELTHIGFTVNWFPFGVQITLPVASQLLLILVLTVLLIRRLVYSVRRQRLMALDVKQAQEVQHVILPQARTVFPGLVVESEYRPAREVGGDFFQIIPHPTDGSLLIVTGDVAGKGLKAGMLVALLVGGIRSTVEWTQDPEQVLRALNQRLMGRGDAFATCQVLHISPAGAVTLANAGHLPPYRNGEAMELDGSFPLGLTESPVFTTLRFELQPDDRLVLISDGILEATNPARELFGFERVHTLLRASANAASIAEAAQNFGQEDDISVITLLRTAAA